VTLRIAMVGACPFPVAQGSQVYLADTARQAAAAGHQVHLIVYGYGLGDPPADLRIHRCAAVPGQGKTLAGPSFAKAILDLALVGKVRRVIREQRVDIVHAHNYEGLAVALAARKRPIVYHAHNAMADELPYYFGGVAWARRFGQRLDQTLPKRADACVVPHERLRNYLIENGCREDAVFVIAPAIDANALPAAPVPVAAPTVLYTGNLDAYQNLDLLKAAMAQVRDVIPGARLCVATADERPFPADERVQVNNLSELAANLARDVVVACPRVSWSGYPIKLLNAMGAGRAIVACESAAHPLANEINGLVVPDNDAEAFGGALVRLLQDSDLRSRLGAGAIQSVLETHSPTKAAHEIDAVYRGLV
jgi:glycosyltransferase involved in cell wall biosynthesis